MYKKFIILMIYYNMKMVFREVFCIEKMYKIQQNASVYMKSHCFDVIHAF